MKRSAIVWTCIFVVACGPPARDEGDGDGTGDPGGGPGTYDPGTNPEDFSQHVHDILMLDFRSGWWAGSAGEFHRQVLDPLRSTEADVQIEFHHFTQGSDIKCIYPPTGEPTCENATMSQGVVTAEEVRGRFEKSGWDEYTQVWILSGSEKDLSDIQVSGDIFEHFAEQAGASCIPFFIGAGDGFIDHGNAFAQSVGLGPILATELGYPGFFFGTSPFGQITADSHMGAGAELETHSLFTGVEVVADGVNNGLQHARGDYLVENPEVEVIATDSAGRPVIGIGELPLGGGDPRPFIIDAGMQRYYAVGAEPDTLILLQNILRHLASIGCRAVID
jgi:hypothetical protein